MICSILVIIYEITRLHFYFSRQLYVLLWTGRGQQLVFWPGRGYFIETSPPTVLTDGNLNTLEGCSTISNDNGQLLFYTDGTIIYQADGSVMTNGNGLLGSSSSTQSAIIIPKPLDPTIYYVFTVDDVGQDVFDGPYVTDGINYSIVDFSTNPKGEVTQKTSIYLIFQPKN